MTPAQELEIRRLARHLQELHYKLQQAKKIAKINIDTPWPNTAQQLTEAEDYAVLQVKVNRATLALRAAQEAAAKEGTT